MRVRATQDGALDHGIAKHAEEEEVPLTNQPSRKGERVLHGLLCQEWKAGCNMTQQRDRNDLVRLRTQRGVTPLDCKGGARFPYYLERP